MKLTKILLAGLVAFGAVSVANANGTINFSGQVVDTPCSIGGGNGTPVDFGTLALKSLTPGASVGVQPFTIDLTGCVPGAMTGAEIKFTGIAGPDSTFGVTGTAQNIGIQIIGAAGPIAPGGSDTRVLQAGNNTYAYTAAVVADSDVAKVVTAGNFNAVANYTITYQ